MEIVEKLNLYQKLVEIRKQVKYIKKDNKGFNFNYASGEDVICAIRPMMDELGIILVPNMESFEFIEIKKGAGMVSVPKITISHTWINAEEPEEQLKTQAVYFEDKMAGCQSVGAMMTYAERYFLYKFFQIATGADDIEKVYKDNNWSNKISDQVVEERQTRKPEAQVQQAPHIAINKDQVNDFVCFCHTLFGSRYSQNDITGFVERVGKSCHDSTVEFAEKCEVWKKNVPDLISNFERSMVKFKSKATVAPIGVPNIA